MGVPSTIGIVSARHQLPLGDSNCPALQTKTSQYPDGPDAVHELPLSRGGLVLPQAGGTDRYLNMTRHLQAPPE